MLPTESVSQAILSVNFSAMDFVGGLDLPRCVMVSACGRIPCKRVRIRPAILVNRAHAGIRSTAARSICKYFQISIQSIVRCQ